MYVGCTILVSKTDSSPKNCQSSLNIQLLFFKGTIIDFLGAYTNPVIRAMIATCVPQEELGKVYTLIAIAECIVPLIVSQAYASVFKVMNFPVLTKT